jgi:hypothetical protein
VSDYIPQDGAFTLVHDGASGQRQYGSSTARWTGPDTHWTPGAVQSSDPHDEPGYYTGDYEAGDLPSNIHGERSLTSRDYECSADGYECDSVGDQSADGSDPDDLSGSDDPHDTEPETVTGDFEDDLGGGDDEPNIRGIGFFPTTYAPSQGVRPYSTAAGPVSW